MFLVLEEGRQVMDGKKKERMGGGGRNGKRGKGKRGE